MIWKCHQFYLFKIISVLFPTSDFLHPIVTPATLLLAHYLVFVVTKNNYQIICKLFICSLLHHVSPFSSFPLPSSLSSFPPSLSSLTILLSSSFPLRVFSRCLFLPHSFPPLLRQYSPSFPPQTGFLSCSFIFSPSFPSFPRERVVYCIWAFFQKYFHFGGVIHVFCSQFIQHYYLPPFPFFVSFSISSSFRPPPSPLISFLYPQMGLFPLAHPPSPASPFVSVPTSFNLFSLIFSLFPKFLMEINAPMGNMI